MPLDKFVLIVVLVVIGAAVTVWVGALVAAAVELPALAGLVALPALLAFYVIWRVVADRLRSREDDRYDQIEK